METIDSLAARTRSCALTPHRLFPAWSGVLTLSYAGFPTPLAQLKAQLGDLALPENPGSRWPKTTLGACKDGVSLSPEQVETLRGLCAVHDERLSASAHRVLVEELHTVLFACPSLERVLLRTRLRLEGAPSSEDALDAHAVSPEEVARVAAVLAEFDEDRDGSYSEAVAREGKRESAYRGAGAASGATLVAPLSVTDVEALALQEFRDAVDAALPGCYAWFDDASLHVTVRGLL